MRFYKMNVVFAVFFVLCGIGVTFELLPGEEMISKALQFTVASNLQKQKPREVDAERKVSISSAISLRTVEESQKELEVHLAEILPMPTVLVALIAQYCKPLTFALKKKWKLSAEFEHGIDTVSCSPDGRVFATGSPYGDIAFWDMDTLQKLKGIRRTDGKPVSFGTFLSSKHFLCSGGEEGDLYTWNCETGDQIGRIRLLGGKLLNIFCSNTERLYVKKSHKGSDTMEIRTLEANADSVFLKGHAAEVTSAAFSPDGKQVVSAAYDGTIRLWDRVAGKGLHTFTYFVSAGKVTWSPNGKFIVSAHFDRTIKVLDVVTKVMYDLSQEYTDCLDVPIIVSPDSSFVVFRDGEYLIKVWNLESKCVQTLPVDSWIISPAISPCGTKLIGGDYLGNLHQWEGS